MSLPTRRVLFLRMRHVREITPTVAMHKYAAWLQPARPCSGRQWARELPITTRSSRSVRQPMTKSRSVHAYPNSSSERGRQWSPTRSHAGMSMSHSRARSEVRKHWTNDHAITDGLLAISDPAIRCPSKQPRSPGPWYCSRGTNSPASCLGRLEQAREVGARTPG
jgi:hypothetical protein